MTTYIVVSKHTANNNLFCDRFYAKSISEAVHCFEECYRHSDYKIIGVLEEGE